MKKEQIDDLLNRFYKGETSLEEEAWLKENISEFNDESPEQDVFDFYNKESEIPAGLEETIFNAILGKEKHRKTITRRLFSIISAAAVITIVLGVYLDFRDKKQKDIETRFFVMELAIAKVSETLTPQEPEDMLVLWVDDNVEIIIN
jgi:hypothetical protein